MPRHDLASADPPRSAVGARFLLCVLALVLAACEESNTYVAPPPPKVTIATPLSSEITDYLEFTGTTEASAQVEVRARVAGILQRMGFEPGTLVEQGDVLFVIDPDVYQAEVERAQAAVAQAEAASDLANATLDRVRQAGEAVSQTQIEVAAAEARTAEAEILARKADLRQATINLAYTEVVAPISGRVGRNRVDVGNLVGAGEATVLTEITDFDPIYVYFSINERDLLRVLDLIEERVADKPVDPQIDPTDEAKIPVEMGLADEAGYPHQGLLDFSESGVDPQTGTLKLRAVFENQGMPPPLVPGLFARVRMPIAQRADMPLVSERAIGADQSGRFVLVVGEDGVVEKRNVRVGQLIDGLNVIEDGVQSGDRIVVRGLQRARPQATVEPETVDMASFRTSAADDATPQ
jgi:RND family efflux transporter MFP subunit